MSFGSKVAVSGESVNEALIAFNEGEGLDEMHRLFDCSSGGGMEQNAVFVDREPSDGVPSDSAIVVDGVDGSDVTASVDRDEDRTPSVESRRFRFGAFANSSVNFICLLILFRVVRKARRINKSHTLYWLNSLVCICRRSQSSTQY